MIPYGTKWLYIDHYIGNNFKDIYFNFKNTTSKESETLRWLEILRRYMT